MEPVAKIASSVAGRADDFDGTPANHVDRLTSRTHRRARRVLPLAPRWRRPRAITGESNKPFAHQMGSTS